MTKLEYLAMSHNKGLKVKTINGDILDLIGVVNNDVYVEHPEYGTVKYNSFDVLPILRPLSAITKEIVHDREKFFPAARMITHGFHNPFWYDYNKFCYRHLYAMDLEILIEWKFDVAKLIKKSEAIDVNSLEIDPYK